MSPGRGRRPGIGVSRRFLDSPSGKTPFSACSRLGREGRVRETAPIGGGPRTRPQFRARRRPPRRPRASRADPPRREPRHPGREIPRMPTSADFETRGGSGESGAATLVAEARRRPGIGASRRYRDELSRKSPFSAWAGCAVWKNALLGMLPAWAGRACPGNRADRRRLPGSSAIPRSSAAPASPGDAPGQPSPPRTATTRTRNPADAENSQFRDA